VNPLAKGIVMETIVKISAAVAAAYIIGQIPQLRAWIQEQWGKTNNTGA